MTAHRRAGQWAALVGFALACLLVCVLAGKGSVTASAQSGRPVVTVLNLDDTIQPISEDFVARGIAQASAWHAEALIVELNTPGGLLDTTRSLVGRLLASPVPVVVYVAPTGSRAGSAGFFLLEAADVAAMAPGTNAGASHPVIESGTLDPLMKEKLENDTTAFLRSFVTKRGRNVDAAQDAVLHSKSYTEHEALDLHLIDRVAPDLSALLQTLDGRTVTRFNGQTVVLHTANAEVRNIQPTLREAILDRLMDPNLAVLILVLGGLLIYIEFNAPGTIIPGAMGTLLLLTALFALNLLPVHYTAVMLLLASFVLMLLEAKFPSHGVLAVVGIVALIFGTLTLVSAPIPELEVHLATALSCGAAFGFITTVLVRIAIRARRNKVITGPEAMIGSIGLAQENFTPFGEAAQRGQILIHGELWLAEAVAGGGMVQHRESVRVLAVRGLLLLVERVPGPLSRAE
ncbi:nodulation protein NfeD [Silvibacterium dinghuense]|uniref:Nodulation protein NfeD n=2 Tax=Silvibacterium dinghuense TaxID=1560006 RepID=A0A4Q1SBW8_9BACT|nr:nodulation protein NfeD [Silvibacterium dinghuense]